jgi:excisionase family DNA binding protein
VSHAPTRLRPSVRGKRLASIDDAAEYCGVSTKTIRRRISDGTISGFVLGPRLLRVDLNEVDDRLLRPIPTAG